MITLRAVLVCSALMSHLTISDPDPDPVIGLFGAGALLGYCANGGVRVTNQGTYHQY